MHISDDYQIFQRFIDAYLPTGFVNINREDPLILEMEEKMRLRRQFFYIGDLIHIRIIFTSQGSKELIGIEPDTMEPGNLYLATHPTDIERMNLARLRLFRSGTELFEKKDGSLFYSLPFYLKDPLGSPIHMLFQGHLFYSTIPHETVFVLFVHTDISSLKIDKNVFHHYLGPDPSVFRYPDEALLHIGHVFSDREFEILELIAKGMESDEIAAKLFLSVHTVNTHRRNILRKAEKHNTYDLVLALKEKGIL